MLDRNAPDLTNLPRFVEHLGDRDAALAAFVSQLLNTKWEVVDFWGPEQMDVWLLVLQRGTRLIRFDIERGMVGGVGLGSSLTEDPKFSRFSFAVLGWARSCGAVLPLDDPDRFFPAEGLHGAAALEWLEAGNDETFDRIRSAWAQYSAERYGPERQRSSDWLVAVKQRGIQLIEEAAAPRHPGMSHG